jgi:ribosome-associated toxin RatA of RatAB toxin-antitoxin module
MWFGCFSVYAQENSWNLVKDASGIKVYSMEIKHSKLNEVLVTTHAKTSVSTLVSIIKDASNHKNWIYLCKEGKMIRSVNPDEWIYYSQSNAPWPFEDRDVVSKVKLVRDAATGTVVIRSNSIKGFIPIKSKYIRIPFATSQWTFTPEKNGFTKIALKIEINLGGNIPKWLMRLTASAGPYHTLRNLLIQVKRPKYNKIHLPVLQYP